MVIDVPRRDESGNITCTLSLNEVQIQALLEFSLNFLVASGLSTQFGIVLPEQLETPTQLDD